MAAAYEVGGIGRGHPTWRERRRHREGRQREQNDDGVDEQRMGRQSWMLMAVIRDPRGGSSKEKSCDGVEPDARAVRTQ
jgi:hypothetical protein